jgi:predicted transcriptional regulator
MLNYFWSNDIKPEEVAILQNYKLGAMETKFAELIWDNEPISSGELVKLCEKELSWKKSTTYTMLRRLCMRKIFKNNNGVVSSVITRQEFQALQSEQFVKETFNGSLPQFLAAFTLRKKLSEKEINELQKLIDENRS